MGRRLFTVYSITLFAAALLLIPGMAHALPAGSVVTNIAYANYGDDPNNPTIVPSNEVQFTIVDNGTESVIQLMQYAPTALSASLVQVNTTQGRSSGAAADPFEPLDPPIPFGRSAAIDLDDPVPLLEAEVYHGGEPVFLMVTDEDQNADSTTAETILVTLTVEATGDVELVIVTETGPNTGVFAGYIQSNVLAAAVQYDGYLDVVDGAEILAEYTDPTDGTDKTAAAAMVDPSGVVFNSSTGEAVDGVTVTLIDVSTGNPAVVYGDDGTSIFPSSIESGGTVTDNGGTTYDFATGGFRFPYVLAGDYRLEITTSEGYTAPSTVSTAVLQALPNAPFDIRTPGSRGEDFSLAADGGLALDVPVDPNKGPLWITKSANKDTAAIGDFVQYEVTVENSSNANLEKVLLTDRLPLSFRYQSGSLKIDGKKRKNPDLSKDGRTLSFEIGAVKAGESLTVNYVTEITVGTPLGEAMNTAQAFEILGGSNSSRKGSAPAGYQTGIASNEAHAIVLIKDDFFNDRCIIMGQVTADHCPSTVPPKEGEEPVKEHAVKGVRIFLEDGQYAVTDENGMYHFEGVTPGVHVVQLDEYTLPDMYEAAFCEENTRHAGRPFSQFVDLQGGTMWRSDFYVATKPTPTGSVGITLVAKANDKNFTLQLIIENKVVPISKTKAIIMLPEGVEYITGSSALNGLPIDDPKVMGPSLTYSIGEIAGDSQSIISYKTTVSPLNEKPIFKAVLLFNTPTAAQQRLPVVEFTLGGNPEPEKNSSCQETIGSLDIKEEGFIESNKPIYYIPEFDSKWLAKAKPGNEFLWPEPGDGPAISAIKLAIKHDPKQKIKIYNNGDPISPLYFEGIVKNSSNTIAVSKWFGVPINKGDNIFEVIATNPDGQEAWRESRNIHYAGPPVNVEVLKDQPYAIADGKTPPVILVRLTDKDGYPARRGTFGDYSIESPYEPYEEIEAVSSDPLSPNTKDRYTYRIGEDGVAPIKLNPTTQTGEVKFYVHLSDEKVEDHAWLKPGKRDWILVGLAEGTAGYRMVNGHQENLDDADLEDKWYKDGRTAFFAKGQIKGEWLLTLSYDSERDSDEARLFQDIDPDEYYTLYGDASTSGAEAASTEKLYVKVERGKFYSMYGDYDTGLTMTELSAYSRTLTGFKTKLDSKHVSLDLFAAETNQAFVKDEIRGDGTSGLYYLSRRDIVESSETVTIETRDRHKSQDILSSESLSRNADYTIDYDQGTIFFKSPVMSTDDGFNPVYIVVDYEAEDSDDKDATYGGRLALKALDEKIELGGTHVHEGGENTEADLLGADLTVEVTENTELKAEYAHTDSEEMDESSSGEAYLAELSHDGAKADGRVYYRKQGAGFGVGQQNASESGTEKYGAELDYHVTEKLDATAEAYRNTDLGTRARDDMGEATVEYTQDRYSLETGIRAGEEKTDEGDVNRVTQVLGGAKVNFLDKKLVFSAEHEQAISNDNANTEYPTAATLGVDYRIIEQLSLFAQDEMTWSDDQETESIRGGFKLNPWKGANFDTSLEQTKDIAEDEDPAMATLANFTVGQNVTLFEKWNVDASVDHSRTLDKTGYDSNSTDLDSDFVATSWGVQYTEKDWSASAKVEFRFADDTDKWNASVGWYGEVDDGLGISLGALVTRNDYNVDGNEDASGDLRIGLAWRPKFSRWIVLDRLDLIWEDDNDADSPYETRKLVNNLNANYKTGYRTQVSFKHGAKYVLDNIDGDSYSGFTDLYGLEFRYDVAKKWDLGLRACVRHSWNSHQLQYSTGPSVGYNPFTNAWVGAGYNVIGFRDEDFTDGDFFTQGLFFQFRLKFDQYTKEELEQFFGF
ncbi:conserved repeat domain protein [Desulfatibacillum aliphaticivorans]|uniref:Conserved repeat domain protein n=1 Tax=Desulfatibacillum aliphaticivorans TaxID=218208 RepID=B8F9Z3_DESAL|nr:isopeptide-forming domain-containing fimbrial protein [Desulfatibacillum aliphaticivorans]ACL03089.1 conserved repeat domain protein [Desulfatibacillum aliphaticivorans]